MEPRTRHRFPQRVKRLYLLMAQTMDEALAPHGLARSQWLVLSRVHRAGTLSQKELQADMRVESATLTGIVDALVAKHWIERLENPADKRGKLLKLTAEGEARWRAIPNPSDIVEKRMFAGMAEKDRRAFEASVETMIENLKGRQNH